MRFDRYWNRIDDFWMDDDFRGRMDHGNHRERCEIHPERVELIKSMAICKEREAKEQLYVAQDLQALHLENNDMKNHIDNIEKDKQVLWKAINEMEKVLKAYKDKFWQASKCTNKDCKKGIDRYFSTWRTCNECDWVGVLLPEHEYKHWFMAIDVASNDSKDGTCVITYKKKKDGIIEVIDTQIIKPKKTK